MKVHMRKRRVGWCSQGQGNGSVQHDGTTDDDSADDDSTDDLPVDEQIKRLSSEARKRRLQAKEWRKRAEAAEARLAENGQSGGPDAAEVILTLVESGMSKDRIGAAMKLVDWSTVTDVDDAIDELREQHPFLFESTQQRDLPAQGSKGNRDKNKNNQPSRQDLIRKYPSLGGGMGNPAKWAGR